MSETITYSGELTVTKCWCGMAHAVPVELYQYQQRKHDEGRQVPSIYCPLGHGWVPGGKPAVELERKRRQRLEQQLASRDEDLRAARASHSATKGQLTKARKRAANGVCPCCNRSFVDVARHMRSKHPNELERIEEAK